MVTGTRVASSDAARRLTRRGLLAAGGAAVLAGCGPPDKRVHSSAEVLESQRRAAQELTAAFAGLPDADRARVAKLAARAAARAARLGAERPAAPAPTTLDDVLKAEQAALRAHVAGVGQTTDVSLRTLLAGLVADGAQDLSSLLGKLGRDPLATAFPGEPA